MTIQEHTLQTKSQKNKDGRFFHTLRTQQISYLAEHSETKELNAVYQKTSVRKSQISLSVDAKMCFPGVVEN